jgi:signal transduction histidine kinase
VSGGRRAALPLWTWAAGGAVLSALLVTGGSLSGLALAGRLDDSAVGWCLGLGSAAVVVVTVTAAIGAHRTAAALRSLRDEALVRLRDPAAAIFESTDRGVRGTAELAELSAALDALALRMRVADELSMRHRTSAEQASAGMFELLSGLTAAEEAARGQLSAELHDTVAQSLALARTSLAQGDGVAAGDLLDEAEDQVRAIMARTRPPALRDGDLGSAVGGLRDEMGRRYGLAVRVSWPDAPVPLPLATAIIVYRFFQEALLNVVKHADVDAASAALAVDGDAVVATVSDQGPGFDLAAVRSDRGRHVGLGLLRERVRLAGGLVDVRSGAGQGTTLTLRLPLSGRPGAGGSTGMNGASSSPAPAEADSGAVNGSKGTTGGDPVSRARTRPATSVR